MTETSIRDVKKKIGALLKLPDIEIIFNELINFPSGKAVNALFSFLYHEDPVLKWHAVTAMGRVVANIARGDMEAARVIMRRLMWNLNDESGGIGWGSAEAMGEILASNEDLAREYYPILFSYGRENGNFQEHELMQRGVLWGIGRFCHSRPDLVKGMTFPYINSYLIAKDPAVRGLGAWVSGLMGLRDARSNLDLLRNDEHGIELFRDRKLHSLKVKDLAEEALVRLDRKSL